MQRLFLGLAQIHQVWGSAIHFASHEEPPGRSGQISLGLTRLWRANLHRALWVLDECPCETGECVLSIPEEQIAARFANRAGYLSLGDFHARVQEQVKYRKKILFPGLPDVN